MHPKYVFVAFYLLDLMEPDSKTEKDYACTGFIFLQNNWPEFLLATPARA